VKVVFLVHELGRSGGVGTILSYARALGRREGWEVEIVLTADPPDGGFPDCDVAVATWWATAEHLWEVPARRRVVFLQSIENRFYEERHFFERFAAEQVLTLPVHYVTVAGWIRDAMAELRPDATCEVVRNGVDKAVFGVRRREPRGGPLRVLVEGQPSLWFKGVEQAVAAVESMTEPAELTVVAPDPERAGHLGGARLVGGLDAAGMAALYAEQDVLVKLARVESLGLAPIEAFHAGVPAVVTPYTGHEEYLEHGRNGLVAGFDDEPGTARFLDRLARDRDLLERLSAGALETAARWPSSSDAGAAFAAALAELAERPEPEPGPALAHLQRAHRRWLELSREHAHQLEQARGAVLWYQRALAESRAHTEELNAALRDADRELVEATRRIEEIKATKAYRAAVGARRLILRRPG
jgi:glycosyltransferase involved in cell wall biosynthesis